MLESFPVERPSECALSVMPITPFALRLQADPHPNNSSRYRVGFSRIRSTTLAYVCVVSTELCPGAWLQSGAIAPPANDQMANEWRRPRQEIPSAFSPRSSSYSSATSLTLSPCRAMRERSSIRAKPTGVR
jgi:hypothetical protein